MISSFRLNYGYVQLGRKLVVLATLCQLCVDQVRDAQLRAGSSAGISGVWVTDALGLPMHTDGLHLLTNAQVQCAMCVLYSRICIRSETGRERKQFCP